jgi:hypothetical protein
MKTEDGLSGGWNESEGKTRVGIWGPWVEFS